MKYWLLISTILMHGIVFAESRRIQVYPITQAFYDVKPGDTLGEILKKILPHSTNMRAQLVQGIVQSNPNAFIDANPDRLKAHVRLWLPNHTSGLNERANKNKFTVREYSWGYTKTPK